MSPKDKRKSRILAVQLAYGCELSENSAENLLETCFTEKNIQKKSVQKYSLQLVKITQTEIDKIDDIIIHFISFLYFL